MCYYLYEIFITGINFFSAFDTLRRITQTNSIRKEKQYRKTLVAYTTLVRPKLEYNSTVWGAHTKDDIIILERVNIRAARLVFNKSWKQRDVSLTALLKQLGWQQLEDRRKHQCLVMLFKIANPSVLIPPSQLVIRHGRTTRGHTAENSTPSELLVPVTKSNTHISQGPSLIGIVFLMKQSQPSRLPTLKWSLAAHLC